MSMVEKVMMDSQAAIGEIRLLVEAMASSMALSLADMRSTLAATTLSPLPAMDIPGFDGAFDDLDPITWLAQANQYFLMHGIAPEQRIRKALTVMTGNALFWGQWTLRRDASMTWEQFSEKLVERFGDSFEEKPVSHNESSNEGEKLPPPSLLPTVSLPLSPPSPFPVVSLHLPNSRENFSDVIGGDVLASLCNWAIKKSSWKAMEELKGQFSTFSLEDKAVSDNRGIDRIAPSVKGCARPRLRKKPRPKLRKAQRVTNLRVHGLRVYGLRGVWVA